MKLQFARLALLLFSLTFFACNGAESPRSVTEDQAPTAAVNEEPALEVVTEDLALTQDAGDELKNNTPVVIAPETMPEPKIKEAKVAAPPPTPQPPARDATITEDKPVVKATPAPKPPTETVAPDVAPTTPPAPAAAPKEPVVDIASPAPDHTPWNTLLQKHVNAAGDVNYAAFKREETKLDAYLATLAAATPASDWGRKAAMAYWINAYNAFTIKRILNDYPLKSITDLDGGDPWKVKWIQLDGKTYSLNNIEHDILRPQYGDPRIHFAVNCAATSCPPIPNKAFTAANLNSLLQSRARSFIRNADYNLISGNEVKVSKIFDWYGKDFGDLRTYLNKYLPEALPAGAEIGFKEYDWALNEQ